MKIKPIDFLYVLLILLFAGNTYGYSDSSSRPLLPEGLILKDIYDPGFNR